MSDDAGALLVRAGLLQDDDLRQARERRIAEGGTLGEHLVLAGLIDDDALTQFFRTRLMVPQVNPNHLARLSPSVIAKLPPDMATEFRTVPVSIDGDGNLMLAMSDPSDSHAVDEIAFFTGHYVVRAVATQMQIAWCLAHYYGCVSALGARLLKPREGNSEPVAAPRARSVTGQISAERRRVMPPSSSVADDLPAPRKPAASPVPSSLSQPSASQGADDRDDDDGDGEVLEIQADSPSDAYRIGDDTNPTGPIIIIQDPSSPPELAARHGELLARGDAGRPSSELPAVMVDITGAIKPDPAAPAPTDADDDATPAVIHTGVGTESRPIMLTRSKSPSRLPLRPGTDSGQTSAVSADDNDSEETTGRRAAAPPQAAAQDQQPEPSEVIVLSTPKAVAPQPPTKRRARSTRVGMGFDDVPKAKKSASVPVQGLPGIPARSGFDEEDSVPPTFVDDAPSEGIPDMVEPEESDGATGQFLSLGEPVRIGDDIDDGWGPPGSTIPPPFLGAMPGTGPSDLTGEIPLAVDFGDDTQEHSAPAVLYQDDDLSGPVSIDGDPSNLADASARLVDTLRAIDRARSRDMLIDIMLAYLAAVRGRVAFLAIKAGKASLWKASPVPTTDPASLSLEGSSTLRDVVATRLPFRGPLADDPSRLFLAPILGDEEILLVPISVRERVVGVLGGGVRKGKVFDEHLAVLARAAGTALERILKSRRTG